MPDKKNHKHCYVPYPLPRLTDRSLLDVETVYLTKPALPGLVL